MVKKEQDKKKKKHRITLQKFSGNILIWSAPSKCWFLVGRLVFSSFLLPFRLKICLILGANHYPKSTRALARTTVVTPRASPRHCHTSGNIKPLEHHHHELRSRLPSPPRPPTSPCRPMACGRSDFGKEGDGMFRQMTSAGLAASRRVSEEGQGLSIGTAGNSLSVSLSAIIRKRGSKGRQLGSCRLIRSVKVG